MFKIDDCILYGMTGVCKITDIKKEVLYNGTEKEYYVLAPMYSKNIVIKVPVDNKKINMRKLHSKAEVNSLITSMPSRDILWIDDDKERDSTFKSMIKTGECEDLITVIKSIYTNKNNRSLQGKKLNKSDDESMKIAENLLNEEFATILGIAPDEVTEYITENLEGDIDK